MTKTVVGVACYSPDTWTALRAVAPDAVDLEDTYEDWLAVFENGLSKVRAAGVNPQRVEIDLAAFSEWCRTVGRPLDSAARAAFVSELLRRRDGHPPSLVG